MKKAVSLLLLVIMLIGCTSNTKSALVPTDSSKFETELKPILEKLNEEDRALLISYMTRAKVGEVFGGKGIPVGTTVEDAIQQERKFSGNLTVTVAPKETATPKPPAPTTTPKPPEYQLELLSTTSSQSYGYYTVEGQVKNLTDKSMDGVQAVIQWYDEKGDFASSDYTYITFNPLAPGQTSPFKLTGKVTPSLINYTITFKKSLGGTITTKDSRKK